MDDADEAPDVVVDDVPVAEVQSGDDPVFAEAFVTSGLLVGGCEMACCPLVSTSGGGLKDRFSVLVESLSCRRSPPSLFDLASAWVGEPSLEATYGERT